MMVIINLKDERESGVHSKREQLFLGDAVALLENL